MYSNKTLLFIQIRDDQVQPTDHSNFREGSQQIVTQRPNFTPCLIFVFRKSNSLQIGSPRRDTHTHCSTVSRTSTELSSISHLTSRFCQSSLPGAQVCSPAPVSSWLLSRLIAGAAWSFMSHVSATCLFKENSL